MTVNFDYSPVAANTILSVSQYRFALNSPIYTLNPSSAIPTGTVTSVPALPAGLSVSSTCVITGTPTVAVASDNYTITSTASGGFTSTINIAILSNMIPVALQVLTLPSPTYTAYPGALVFDGIIVTDNNFYASTTKTLTIVNLSIGAPFPQILVVNASGTPVGSAATITGSSATVTLPPSPGSYYFYCIFTSGPEILYAEYAVPFTVTNSPTPTPTIASYTPQYGIATGGSSVTLTGTNFSSTNTVTFGSNTATNVSANATGTQLTATVPAASGSVTTVSVVNIAVQSVTVSPQFTYYANAEQLAIYLFSTQVNPNLPATLPGTLTAAMLGSYFSTLLTLGLSQAEFLAYRTQFVTTLFSQLQTKYSLPTPIASIPIAGTTFPYTSVEFPGYFASPQNTSASARNNYIDTSKPKLLINYAVQNYYVQDFSGSSYSQNLSALPQVINQASYANMPNSNGNTFTYVFNNVVLISQTSREDICTCFFGADTNDYNAIIINIYCQVDVELDTNNTPSYRLKVLTSSSTNPTTTLKIGQYYIILNPGSVTNWAAMDSANETGETYTKYSTFLYNGTAPNAIDYSVELTVAQQIVPATGRTTAQTLMQVDFTQTFIQKGSNVSANVKFNYMMGSINGLGGTYGITVLSTSNICFPAGTPIQTDQGLVNIDKLQPTNYTIGGKAIQHITQTVTLDPYLIRFEPNALGYNIPNETTIMTKDHHIFFHDQLVPAYRFLDYSDKVKKVKYSGEVLYNVLLAQHGTMLVNNMVCETLHPENVIAKLYNSSFSQQYKNKLICLMNESLQKKDLQMYKSIVNRMC